MIGGPLIFIIRFVFFSKKLILSPVEAMENTGKSS